MGWRDYGGWAPYKPVAQRRAEAAAAARRLTKKGQTLNPIKIPGRAIATTFWGKSWCEHLERFSDFANRLPRGRTYARNGSILDLQIRPGEITALVSGSELYKIKIQITKLAKPRWLAVCDDCSHSVHSLIDLMRGKLSSDVIERLTDKKKGIFPEPNEIHQSCDCPDYAGLCKHLAAVLYGVGHRLDTDPQLLFVLRGVDQADLISRSLSSDSVRETIGDGQPSEIAENELADIFGIEFASPVGEATSTSQKATKTRRGPAGKLKQPLDRLVGAAKKVTREKVATKKTIKKKVVKKKVVAKKSAVKTKVDVQRKAAVKKKSLQKKTSAIQSSASLPSKTRRKKTAKKK